MYNIKITRKDVRGSAATYYRYAKMIDNHINTEIKKMAIKK